MPIKRCEECGDAAVFGPMDYADPHYYCHRHVHLWKGRIHGR